MAPATLGGSATRQGFVGTVDSRSLSGLILSRNTQPTALLSAVTRRAAYALSGGVDSFSSIPMPRIGATPRVPGRDRRRAAPSFAWEQLHRRRLSGPPVSVCAERAALAGRRA